MWLVSFNPSLATAPLYMYLLYQQLISFLGFLSLTIIDAYTYSKSLSNMIW